MPALQHVRSQRVTGTWMVRREKPMRFPHARCTGGTRTDHDFGHPDHLDAGALRSRRAIALLTRWPATGQAHPLDRRKHAPPRRRFWSEKAEGGTAGVKGRRDLRNAHILRSTTRAPALWEHRGICVGGGNGVGLWPWPSKESSIGWHGTFGGEEEKQCCNGEKLWAR